MLKGKAVKRHASRDRGQKMGHHLLSLYLRRNRRMSIISENQISSTFVTLTRGQAGLEPNARSSTREKDKDLGFSCCFTYNLADRPAAVARGGTSPAGPPIGVQVVACPRRDDTALAIAHHAGMV